MSLTQEQKRLARTAASIHALLTADPVKSVKVEPPALWWQRVRDDLLYLKRAQERGWSGVLETQRRHALSSLRQLSHEITAQVTRLEQLTPSLYTNLTPHDVYEDLVALEQEFEGKLQWKGSEQRLSIRTEPIELEGRYLGAFRIDLSLKEIHDSEPYTVVALDPQPSARNEDVTHPHVNDGLLCEGDGKTPIRNALRSGRLLDFFLLVNNILHTYNESGPFVSLDAWDGASCADCDGTIEGDSYTCTQCRCMLCSGCECCCERCSDSLCDGCRIICSICESSLCPSCCLHCRSCSSDCCPDCIHDDDERCERCHEEHEQDESPAPATPAHAAV